MPQQEEEITMYCDCENCLHAATHANWIKYRIEHHSHLITEIYAHFCDGHYALFPERVVVIEQPLLHLL